MWLRRLGWAAGGWVLAACDSAPRTLPDLPLPLSLAAAQAAPLETRALSSPAEPTAEAIPAHDARSTEDPLSARTVDAPAQTADGVSARAADSASLCNEQAPQPFLVAAHFDSHFALGEAKRLEWGRVRSKAVRYRTERYGYVKGYGKRAWNERTPAQQAKLVTFFGVSVVVHERIAPALSCVETAIRERCTETYRPAVLSGIRKHNTYLNGEISNHVYGIAIDIDPARNPCCRCVEPWSKSPLCEKKDKFARMAMPKCWVDEFERFGFYWLGHDRIEDTMHFEFLGEPGNILR